MRFSSGYGGSRLTTTPVRIGNHGTYQDRGLPSAQRPISWRNFSWRPEAHKRVDGSMVPVAMIIYVSVCRRSLLEFRAKMRLWTTFTDCIWFVF